MMVTEKEASNGDETDGKDESSGDFMINQSTKRFNHYLNHPCSCPSKTKTVDFGADSYPRYQVSKVCDHEQIARSKNVCQLGSECKENFHKILLLKYRNKDLETINGKHHDLPREIRKDFYWDTQEISIDCRCAF